MSVLLADLCIETSGLFSHYCKYRGVAHNVRQYSAVVGSGNE